MTEEDSEDESDTGDDFAEAVGNEVGPSSTKALEDPDPEASVHAATSSAVPEEVALKSASMRRRMLGTGMISKAHSPIEFIIFKRSQFKTFFW